MSSPDNASGNTTESISGNDTSSNVSGNNQSLNMLNMGTFLKAFGSISSGYADYQTLQSKAAAERFNADLAGMNADMTGREGASNEAALRLKQQRDIGQQRANLAEAGIGPISEGSAGESIRQSEMDANFEALTNRYKANVQRTNYLNAQNQANYSAKIAKKNATQSLWNTGFSATSQLLSGFGRYQNGVI